MPGKGRMLQACALSGVNYVLRNQDQMAEKLESSKDNENHDGGTANTEEKDEHDIKYTDYMEENYV